MVNRKEYYANYYLTHREDLLARSRQWKEAHPHYQQQRQLLQKIEILTHYGGGKLACIQCGEARLDCLSLDHIEDNGAEHRRQRGNYHYKMLKDQGFPEGYQTLCMNCQWIKESNRRRRYSKY